MEAQVGHTWEPAGHDPVETAIPRILNILVQFENSPLKDTIKGRLHCTFKHPGNKIYKLPASHRIQALAKDGKENRPSIYGFVYCSPKGITPTKRQYLTIADHMKTYSDILIT
ncbi:hypothetical protein BDZ45DRAFT_745991 [Acephala macrosclerotiorum]|nr:hypothetical protein BDZ45DRAFT_745991 [Acephala macrosclerotiorum]